MTDLPAKMDLWKKVEVDPELRDLIVLSGKDVHDLTIEAMRAPDPSARLTELLNERGRAKLVAKAKYKADRMAKDIERLSHPERWWVRGSIHVKTQPWVTEARGQMSHGVVIASELTTVAVDGNGTKLITYGSLEELVQTWSVD